MIALTETHSIFENRTILVTGGCGSIGSEIVRQLLAYNPQIVRVLDHSEMGHFRMSHKIKSSRIRHLLGDIRDRDRVMRAMQGVDMVFHAAALKHVHFCEYNPFEAVTTNAIGTKNIVDAAILLNVERVIGISTDKAVNPINVMGATKLLAEKIITNAPVGESRTKFCCVRFGNVLNTSGSVIPIFRKQVREGTSLTITDPTMTRFFMSLHDAVSLVLKAATIVGSGETFILKMKALKITDLAEVMVEELAAAYSKNPLHFTYPVIGVRPGEKIHEALMTKEESYYMTEMEEMYVLHNSILADYGMHRIKGMVRPFEFSSENAPLLSKDEIRTVLYEKGILKKSL